MSRFRHYPFGDGEKSSKHKYSTYALILFGGIILIAVLAAATEDLWTNEVINGTVSLNDTTNKVCLGNICWSNYQLSIQHNASIAGSPVCTAANGYCGIGCGPIFEDLTDSNGLNTEDYNTSGTGETLTVDYRGC